MEDKLVELVTSFEREENTNSVIRECLGFLKRYGGGERQAHARLCCAVLPRADGGNSDLRNVLHFAGGAVVLSVVYDNVMHTK